MLIKKVSTLPTWLRILPAVVISVLMFSFSSIPGQEAQGDVVVTIPNIGGDLLNLFVKKGAHFVVYFLLGQSYWFAFEKRSYRHKLWAVGLAVLFAISDEFHQGSVLARSPSAIDLWIDSFAIWTGLFPFQTFLQII